MLVSKEVKWVKCIWAQCSLFYIKWYVGFDGITDTST